MLIKSADDKTKDINILQGLLNHPAATADVQQKIEEEIHAIRAGVEGEEQAAYEINFYFGKPKAKNWSVIHDLRIEHGERVAQIDHILINRFLDIWVCESKWFAEGIAINEHGECSAFSRGKPYGVPSPIEQNRKHYEVLKAACRDGAVKLPKRLGLAIKPDIKSLVLVSKKARIERPSAKVKGLDEILKIDQFKARIDKDFDSDNNPVHFTKVISPGTLEDFARRLAALHKPITFDWHAKFGLSREVAAHPIHATPKTNAPGSETQADGRKKSTPVCFSCRKPVPDNEAEYCRSHKAKFGGKVYCWACQKKMSATV